METNETRKEKYSKIIQKEKRKRQIKVRKNKTEKTRKKAHSNEKKHTWKKMRFVAFLQTSNLDPNKLKYKS